MPLGTLSDVSVTSVLSFRPTTMQCGSSFLLLPMLFGTLWHWQLQKQKSVNCTLVQALRLFTSRTAYRGSRGIALLFHDQVTRWWRAVSVKPRPLFTTGLTRYPLYRRLGGPQGRSGQMRKISPPSRLDARTVQPVASRCTDYDTRPTLTTSGTLIWRFQLFNLSGINKEEFSLLIYCLCLTVGNCDRQWKNTGRCKRHSGLSHLI